MQAATRTTYGTDKVIRVGPADRPVAGPGTILVEVAATTVNRTDCANLTGRPAVMRLLLGLTRPRDPRLGTDFAGVVRGVGEGVAADLVGRRVFGFRDTGLGSQAEYVVVPRDHVFPIPPGVDDATAVASLEGAHYAYAFLRRVDIRPGQRVLIVGATGAIGSALLQFVRSGPARIAVTAGTKNLDLVRSLGAEEVYDYTRDEFPPPDSQFDFVFDAVGKRSLAACRSRMTANGTYISSEAGAYGQNIWYTLLTKVAPGRRVRFPVPFPVADSVPYITERLTAGIFRPVIDRTFPLADIAAAYRYVLSGEKTGNVIVRVN